MKKKLISILTMALIAIMTVSTAVASAEDSIPYVDAYGYGSYIASGRLYAGIEGIYEDVNIKTVIDRINEIRYEAYEKGFVNVYNPVKWCTQLEDIAQEKAGELAFNLSHDTCGRNKPLTSGDVEYTLDADRVSAVECIDSRKIKSSDLSSTNPLSIKTNFAMEQIEKYYAELSAYEDYQKHITELDYKAGKYENYAKLIDPLWNYAAFAAFTTTNTSGYYDSSDLNKETKCGSVFTILNFNNINLNYQNITETKNSLKGKVIKYSVLDTDYPEDFNVKVDGSKLLALGTASYYTYDNSSIKYVANLTRSCSFTSSDESIIKVDSAGNMTLGSNGKATITVKLLVGENNTTGALKKAVKTIKLTTGVKDKKLVSIEDLCADGHTWNKTGSKAATCTADGWEDYTCTVCGETKRETLKAPGHSYGEGVVYKESTCEVGGIIRYYCTRCENYKQEFLPLADHKISADGHVETKASFTNDGMIVGTCEVCKQQGSGTKIDKVTASISAGSYIYDGGIKTPSVTVRSGNTTLTNGVDYTVSYSSGRKNVGTYYVTVNLQGEKYNGSKTFSYKIVPKTPSIKGPKKAKKTFTARWKKMSTKMSKSRITGYQVQYSTSGSFASSKTTTVKGYKKTSKKIKKLAKKTTYYVRVRTYMKVGGTYYYSNWSAAKSVKTK